MIEITGKAGIVAKILADSVNEQDNRLVTYELTYPRIIHSELLTHKMLCSNSASSRAIPFAKMAQQLTAQPVRFGQANPGMQDKGEDYSALIIGKRFDNPSSIENTVFDSPSRAWESAKDSAVMWSESYYNAGYHKQVYNRLTEPFQMMKTVISGTEWDNFFWLRNDKAADPTLHELARCMQEARDVSVPKHLRAGDWHLPYVDWHWWEDEQVFKVNDEYVSLEDAIKVSCSRTAAVSFRNEDYSLEKCVEVYTRLIGDERKHASAMQHAATPMQKYSSVFNGMELGDCVNHTQYSHTWEPGISHATRDGKLWSAQYCGFVMHRKLIPGENYVEKRL